MTPMPSLAHWLASVDQRLPAAAERADRADLGDLLLAHQDQLRRLVHRLLGWAARPGDVDDIVQDVLLAAWQRRATFRGDASVATWITAIAVHRVHNHARWSRLRRRMWPFGGGEDAVQAAHTACTVEIGDDIATMQRAMARLRHADREVLVLHYLEQRSPRDVATLLGCSVNALEQRLTRARQRLRDQLEPRA